MVGSNGQVHLSAHQSFSAGTNPLRPGYYAVLLTTQAEVKPEQLHVVDDRLHLKKGGGPKPLDTCDYLLYKIEGLPSRDDWRHLSYIDEPLRMAQEALLLGDADKAGIYRTATLVAANRAPDLTVADRNFVIQTIKAELVNSGQGAAGQEPRSLADMMAGRHRSSVGPAVEPAFEEVFGG
jgi:hypothetical protein